MGTFWIVVIIYVIGFLITIATFYIVDGYDESTTKLGDDISMVLVSSALWPIICSIAFGYFGYEWFTKSCTKLGAHIRESNNVSKPQKPTSTKSTDKKSDTMKFD